MPPPQLPGAVRVRAAVAVGAGAALRKVAAQGRLVAGVLLHLAIFAENTAEMRRGEGRCDTRPRCLGTPKRRLRAQFDDFRPVGLGRAA